MKQFFFEKKAPRPENQKTFVELQPARGTSASTRSLTRHAGEGRHPRLFSQTSAYE
jgi:hypothetical protein